MNKKKKTSEKYAGDILPLFVKMQILLFIMYFAVIIIDCIFAYKLYVDRKNYFYIIVISLSFVSLVGGFYSGSKIHKNGLLTGLLFCLPPNIITVLISIIINKFTIDLTTAISFGILLISSMLGGVLSVNIKTKPKYKVKRKTK